MRVGVDGRSLRDPARTRGIARYLHGLLSSLARDFPEDRYAVLVPGGAVPETEELEAAGIEVHRSWLGSRPLFASAALSGRPRLDRLVGGCDVVLLPGVAPVAVSRGVPYVLTVHDLTFEHRPRDFSAYERAWHRVARPRRLARSAARLIADSHTVARELTDEWGIPAGQVEVIPPGPGRPPGDASAPPNGLPDGYFLAVGALEPRKRPDLLIEAHARATQRGLEGGLVLAGEGPMRAELERSQAIVLGFVDDAVLEALYANALALVCVSEEEGFGFTPLEAIARGTPAVVSDLPVFDETLAKGALRVPRGDAGALADALLRVERDPALRQRLTADGAGALGRMSWANAAAATRAVLAEAAG
jgi:glycosyltransferase involved in cell wall biosynthesis